MRKNRLATSANRGRSPSSRSSSHTSNTPTAIFMRQQRQLQRRDRGAEHEEDRRRQPCLDAEHVVLSVEEQRKRPQADQVFGHQPGDRLVGIEAQGLAETRTSPTGTRRSGSPRRTPATVRATSSGSTARRLRARPAGGCKLADAAMSAASYRWCRAAVGKTKAFGIAVTAARPGPDSRASACRGTRARRQSAETSRAPGR